MKTAALIATLLVIGYVNGGILYPKPSSTRDVKSLDGLWKFSLMYNDTVIENTLSGNDEDRDAFFMAVPSSYNDVTTVFESRDHVGFVKYETILRIPPSWFSSNVWLRFGSVCYAATAYIDDEVVLAHDIGHLPFEAQISTFLRENVYEYTLTVLVNNTLNYTTIPQGKLTELRNGRIQQGVVFDFFHYAGIDRPILLYRTPKTRIEDVTVTTSIDGTKGVVNYEIEVTGSDTVDYNITVLDNDNRAVGSSSSITGSITIPEAHLWWPFLMSPTPGYLYTLRIELLERDSQKVLDSYDQSFGIRQLKWDNSTFTINGKAIYFRGFGRHEDSDIRGKGYDLPLIVRDHNLLRWIGANSYRTSHYPYAEEIMDLADSLGIMIIDEVPSVNTQKFNVSSSADLMRNHKRAINELYARDKNRPSVILWSLANEPQTTDEGSEDYFREIVAHMKSLDDTRPITVVIPYAAENDYVGQFLDILCVNYYASWYKNAGDLGSIPSLILKFVQDWHNKYNKPLLITEYGAEALTGFHLLPEKVWSEEYQAKVLSEHFKLYDQMRAEGWFIGEMVWNFADFRTVQSIKRLGGNRKGVFTRERQPKPSAFLLRSRYWALAQELDDATLPEDLNLYIKN